MTEVVPSTSPDRDDPGWWRRPTLAGALGLGLAGAMLAGWRWDPETTAGGIFLLSWAMAGLCVLGALFARGRAREAWLGAALFGLGYLVMAFSFLGSSRWPTNHLLNAVVRPGDPQSADEIVDDALTDDEESRKVQHALGRPISLHFREGTSLKVLLERIKAEGRATLGEPFRIYPTERGPLHREDLETLRVSIDCKNTSMRDALRVALGPLGMTYRVQSGYIRVYPDAYQPAPFDEDPVMIAGHSLIALIAAAFGGLAAPMVAGFLKRPAA